MRRKLVYLILLFYPAISFGGGGVFAQNKAIDKIALARFEKKIEQGDIEEMERPLLDLAIANPNNPQVLQLLATVRWRQNRLSEAAALYKRIVALDANFVSAKINLARIAYLSGQIDEARAMLDGISANSISEAAVRLSLAAAFLQIGEPQKALNTIETLPVKTKNTDALPIVAASYFALQNEQKLRELLPLMKRVAANPALTMQCAEILRNAKMTGEAVALLNAALVGAPNDFDLLIALGRSEIEIGNLAMAKEHLNRAAKLQPRVPQIFLARAMLEQSQGNPAGAFDLLKQARLLAPDSPAILGQFVVAAMRSKQSGAAMEAAEILARTKPDEPEYLYLLGAASLQNNNLDQAQTNLARLMELRPTDSRGCLALGLTLAARKDQIEMARKQFSRCIEIDAKNVEANYQLGLSYKTQGEIGKAIEYLEETTKIAPNYAAALRELGAVYLQTGAEEKARIVLEKAVALAPEDADTHFQLSRLYNLIGETALAKKHLEMFQKLKNPVKGSM